MKCIHTVATLSTKTLKECLMKEENENIGQFTFKLSSETR